MSTEKGAHNDRLPQLGAGVGLGFAVGTALGVAFGNLGWGVALGVGLGAAIDTLVYRAGRKHVPPTQTKKA